jgi:hypothetical protein
MRTWEHSEKVLATIQECVNAETDSEGVVTKFVAVVEVMDTDGKKLVTYRGPSNEACPVWDCRGMMQEVMADADWFGGDDE